MIGEQIDIVCESQEEYDKLVSRIMGTYEYSEEELKQINETKERLRKVKEKFSDVKLII